MRWLERGVIGDWTFYDYNKIQFSAFFMKIYLSSIMNVTKNESEIIYAQLDLKTNEKM